MNTTAVQSIQRRAGNVEVPDLSDQSMVAKGARHFQKTCAMCHGAPGVERAEIGKGLTPEPPELSHAPQHWSSAELFWIVKHGIKMTGMPAWGPTHPNDELWAMVAFIGALPDLSPEAYQDLVESAPSEESQARATP